MTTSPALCLPHHSPPIRQLSSCSCIRRLRQLHAHTITTGAITADLANAIIRCYAAASYPSDALLFYAQIAESPIPHFPDSGTFHLLLKACSSIQSLPLGRMIHSQVFVLGFASKVSVQNLLVHMYASCRSIAAARLVFDGIRDFDDASLNIMIGGLLKCGRFQDARELFDEMGRRDVFSWSVMINWYIQNNRFREGLELFREMLVLKLVPNESIFVNVLSACAHLGALEQGIWVERYLRKTNTVLTVRLGTALVDLYLKCGCVEKAFEVFELMEVKNATTWSAMIGGLAINGHGNDAIRLFLEMEVHGVIPNEVSFVGVLNACSHSGLVSEGLKYFDAMTEVYGLTPNVHHYCCLIDLYGRAGLLDKAKEVIENMPMKPNSAVWGALLNACRIHGKSIVGEQVGKKLLELDPSNSGRYVLLSNIYAANRRWYDVAELRQLMKDRGVSKTTGSSFIDLKGAIHEFIAGDSFHPQRREIYKMLDEMTKELKREGYRPNTRQVSIDMDEEEKENSLYHHSEKLALAFGLINGDRGTTIRITKNLRVCVDCHTVMKMISTIYDREIVVRDRIRFHHFRDGSCSCGDFW